MSNVARNTLFVASLLVALVLQMMRLPEAIAPWRPMWVPMALCYWALSAPELPVLSAAFLTGIACDVLFDGPPGQHALAFIGLALLAYRLRANLVLLPLWQLSLVMMPAWALTAFALFWMDGLNKHLADPWLRWMPVAGTTFAWPLWLLLLNQLQVRRKRRPVRLRAT